MPSKLTPETPPTATQVDFYAFIYSHTKANGFQPSYREAMAHFGYKSIHAVQRHLGALKARRWIDLSEDGRGTSSRAVRFLRKPNGEPFTGFND